MKTLLASVLLAMLSTVAVVAEPLRIGTWNIANLHHESGIPLRDGAIPRDDEDYERLKTIAGALDIDIIALQEIGSPKAAERIFPSSHYHVVISKRYKKNDEYKPPEDRDIFTAFAFSKKKFWTVPKVTSLDALSLIHLDISRSGDPEARPTRSGILTEIQHNGKKIKLLGVHLKSSCHQWSLDPIEDQNFLTGDKFTSRYDCRTLLAQAAILENWIEQQTELGHSVIVVGDFNRRLNLTYHNPTRPEDMWRNLNDGEPNGLELIKGPLGLDKQCWTKHKNRFEEHIDFIVFSKSLSQSGNSDIEKIGLGYDDDPKYAKKEQQRLSDHCPVVLNLSEE